jgi:hypothetical protein
MRFPTLAVLKAPKSLSSNKVLAEASELARQRLEESVADLRTHLSMMERTEEIVEEASPCSVTR